MIQEARARVTVGIFTDMPDAAATEVPPGDSAEAALAFLTEMSPDLRGRRDPRLRAAPCWPPPASPSAGARTPRRCSRSPTAPASEPVEQVHIATEQGEVFALRHAGLAAVAVTERFALASLMFFDMRSTLRDLALDFGQSRPNLGGGGLMPPKPHRVLLDRVSGYADEAAAYMRRRRVARRPFARLYYPTGAAPTTPTTRAAAPSCSSPPGA